MAPYTESQPIETPLSNYFDPFHADNDYWSDDPMKQVRQRMVLIMVAVLVVLLLAMMAVPRWTGIGRGTGVQAQTQTEAAAQEITAMSVAGQPAAIGEQAAAATGQQQPEAAAVPPGTGGISPIFTKEVQHWAPQIVAWAAAYGLDPNIVATIMQIESCGDPQAVSSAGARGLFQVMPFHFTGGEDMHDPDTNAKRGLNFFNEQLRYTGGDVLLSFAGYNGGYAASGSSYDRWASETQRYYTWAKGIYEDAQAGAASSPTLEQWLAAGGGAGCQRAASRLGL